ncbi:MAG: hypothetical protein IJ048_01300 [Clostridia bacterium]|nr:hypothetical protein [Clostridia bacterium]
MRKLAICCLCLALLLCALPASADLIPGVSPWTIAVIDNDLTDDFDNDGTMENCHVVFNVDEYDDGGFTLAVGSSTVIRDDCFGLMNTIYAMRIGWTGYSAVGDGDYYATLFMVPEYGMSDDPYTYCYLYVDGDLIDVGQIPAMPYNMAADPVSGTITTQVRASMIGTWSRPADYILARGFSWDEENFYSYYHLTEVPRPIYPFGMIVSLNQELPLLASQTDRVYAGVLLPEENKQVVLAATDDVRWLYVSSLDGATVGWVKMSRVDWETKLTVGDVEMNVDDVFGDILYAD